MPARERQGPLDGLRVVDMSGMISGAFATTMLGDFGADVVMVEHPERGDPIREFPPFDGGTSLWWKSLARNKRCVTLDLSSEAGRDLALELAADADVLVENFRPGTMERWDLGPEDLHAVNPALVMVRVSGYGQTGPKAEKPGFGTVAEGISGWAHANGFPDREPLLPPISLADLTAGLFAAQATMFAVYDREVGRGGSGDGEVVDVSLTEPLFRLFVGEVAAYDRLGHVRERTGNRHPNTAPRNVYRTADGYMTLSASNQRIFERVMAAIDRPDLVEDPRFVDNGARIEHVEALDAVIEAWTRERTTEDAIAAMEAHDAIVGPVYDVADIVADEQYRAREASVAVDDEDLGRVETAGVVPTLERNPGTVEFLGPRHGQHNEAVYRGELGVDADRYERLVDAGVI